MNTLENAIYMRRKQKIFVTKGNGEITDTIIATYLKNLSRLGYMFSLPLLERCKTLSYEQFLSFAIPLLEAIKQMLGDNKEYKPMYPDFPEQVMTMEDSILYLNAIYHYFTLQLPKDIASERQPIDELPNLKVIDLGDEQEYVQMMKDIIGSKIPISLRDKEDISATIASRKEIDLLLPSKIPLKENVGFVVSELLKHKTASHGSVKHYFQTATDVLRLATALSDGDVSLAKNTKFKKFTRLERRFLLSLLENCSNTIEDMNRHRKRWIRLGEILHPREYQTRFPQTAKAFSILRNDLPIETFARKVEYALKVKNISQVLTVLEKRPGEFARRLDHVLRLSSDKDTVLTVFARVVHHLPSSLLLSLQSHFAYRDKPAEERVFIPKGDMTKYQIVSNKRLPIDGSLCNQIVDLCKEALLSKFEKLPSLGQVYIDPALKDYLVPLSQRSASKSLHTVTRGSKLPIPDGDTIRFFLWWKEGYVHGEHTDIVDIDLSASIYTEDWQYREHISYTRLKSEKYQSVHSGDIVSAPNGACEFIDLHIPTVLQNDCRYVIMSIYCFSEHFFSTLPECFAGWMIRKTPNYGELFEPSTVQNKVDLAANARIAVPVVLDLIERKVYWADMGLKRELDDMASLEKNKRSLAQLGKWMTNLRQPHLYDLFCLHAEARGQRVDNAMEADQIFGIQEGVTPFDSEKIVTEYLS